MVDKKRNPGFSFLCQTNVSVSFTKERWTKTVWNSLELLLLLLLLLLQVEPVKVNYNNNCYNLYNEQRWYNYGVWLTKKSWQPWTAVFSD